MKIVLTFFVALLFISCTPKKTNYSGEYFRIVKGGKYALFNNKGVQLTEGLYENSTYPSEGLIATIKNGKWGYLDRAGNEVIDFKYKRASNFYNGLAIVYVSEDRMGYIDKNGTMVIKPKYQFGRLFSEGFAAVEKDGKWGYIDKNGKAITPFKYDKANSFKYGYATAWITNGENLLKCKIDRQGRESCVTLSYSNY